MPSDNDNEDASSMEKQISADHRVSNRNYVIKQPIIQSGVLRTNCIDCLDRTNVAQYAYGLAALGHQLHALEFLDSPKIDIDSPLADELMGCYERMGDTLAHQYGGSAAHNKVCRIAAKVLPTWEVKFFLSSIITITIIIFNFISTR